MATDFGTDTSCITALRTGRLVSGLRLVAEAAYRRLTTPRGTLRGGDDEANYGFDVSSLLGSAQTAAQAAAIPGQIEAELLKDERITEVTANVSQTQQGKSVFFQIQIDATTDEGPFSLVLAVSDVTTELLGITASS